MERYKLEAAAQRGIISEEQVGQLVDFFASDAAELTGENSEEQLRFIRSFGDIFITIGIVLVSFAVSRVQIGGYGNFVPLLVLFGLTEWLVGKRRLALPGIALLAAILFYAVRVFIELPLERQMGEMVSSVGIIGLSGLFYWRYKMPFAFLTMAGGALLFFHHLIGWDTDSNPLILALYGGIIFLIAMVFDARDVKRQCHLSDTGFWLHMLAAPLIARGVMFALFQAGFYTPMREFMVIGFFLVFFLVALFVDRRALMVSSLIFALAALVSLFKKDLLLNMEMLWLVFTGLGLVMIFVGVNWYQIRSLLFGWMGRDGLAAFVPAFARLKKNKPVVNA